MRVHIEPHARGIDNMARDETLLQAAQPTVRLYGWRPTCVSLGRAQTQADIDLDAAHHYGLDIVQRTTGGGAILHNEQEITYAVILPLDTPGLPRDITGTFTHMSAGVLHALHTLGLPAQIETVPDNTRETLCYVRRQGTNITVHGRKISGAAQRRTDRAILQHGTIIVHRDDERMAAIFRTPAHEIAARVTSLEEEGVHVSREKILDALALGFERALAR